MLVGLLREEKIPRDRRVPFSPEQINYIRKLFPGTDFIIQPSSFRCFSDKEYEDAGIEVREDLSDASLIMGIKEVPPTLLIPSKTYCFFSHTIKKQPHNRILLQTIIEKNIRLVDYECLIDPEGNRIIGFGRFAGVVGAYYGIMGYGQRYGLFDLRTPTGFHSIEELENELTKVKLPNMKMIVTGGGRVANGAIETLGALKIRKVTPYEFINYSFREPVYVQLHSQDYNRSKDDFPFNHTEFLKHPGDFESSFIRFAPVCDILIHCSYWDPRAPKLFSLEEMNSPAFHISVIADITCDVNGSIPSTTRTTTIDDPFFGYDPLTQKIADPFSLNTITVMAVDNLPTALPRDASQDFGKNLIERVMPALLGNDGEGLIERASLTKNGKLMPRFSYLEDYAIKVEKTCQ